MTTTLGTFTTLEVWRDGPVGWLVFDRPGSGNAMDAVMFAELDAAWALLDADDDVRVIVNTGNGRAFQTGLDVVQLARDPAAMREQSRRTKRAELRMTAWHCGVWKPVICAVNGICAGGGLHFVADADIVLVASDAEFCDPHVSVGQVTAYETIGLARKTAMEAVARLALVGRHERVSATRAHQLGITSQVVDPPSMLRAEAQRLAETIAQHDPEWLAATKRALWGAFETGRTEAVRHGTFTSNSAASPLAPSTPNPGASPA